jgi:transcriptional regulator with GAF, ATPase, and Fis domain
MEDPALEAAWAGVSAAFGALGRVFICLDRDYRVIHASETLDEHLGEGAADRAAGRPIEELLGAELFGSAGTLRAALEAGERREGWRASLTLAPHDPLQVSVTAAPLVQRPDGVCDPRVAAIVVVRPSEHDPAAAHAAPTLLAGLVARSRSMLAICRLIENLQHSEATVMLTGESGTGKEVVARAIHAYSARKNGPFVAVSCAALPGELLESEMFGHVRGAFTGAVRDRSGRFELARGGTLFLDEVGDIPLPLQVKLLRVLQEQTFERLGESRSRLSDARIIAATNVDLHRAVAEGRFRDDLYYRLRVVPIEIPPLRERREDIEPLVRHLLARVGARRGRALQLSPSALRDMLGYPWPGNVREIENVLEYATAVCQGQTILPGDLPAELRHGHARSDPVPPTNAAPPPPSTTPDAERLRRVLDAHRWRRAETARALGVSRTTLWRLMREAGLR